LIADKNGAMIRIERLTRDNVHPAMLDGFIRDQQVTECWRYVDGEWTLMPVVFFEHWDAERLREEAAWLMRLSEQGIGFGAFEGTGLIGFAALGERLGSQLQYMELTSLHVSKPKRGKGVGKALFAFVCDAAREAGAQKVFISAHSSRESQAAYRALGCTLAKEPDAARMAAEPYDVQMEFDLTKGR